MVRNWLSRRLFAFRQPPSKVRRNRRSQESEAAAFVRTLESRVLLSAAPIGSEFQVNTVTAGAQTNPDVAMDASGNFVVVWESADTSGTGVFAQRYNASGVAQGGAFQVNNYQTNNQLAPAVAMDADGNFVVVWASFGQDGNGYGVFGQRFNALGGTEGGEFQVNVVTNGDQGAISGTRELDVAMRATGEFIVVWTTTAAEDGSGSGIIGQRFDANGSRADNTFLVNQNLTSQNQSRPSVGIADDGRFVVAWYTAFSSDDLLGGIRAQRYSTLQGKVGSEFRVNDFTSGTQIDPRVAMSPDGDFVVTWTSYGADGSSPASFSINAKRYNSAGADQGSEFIVNTYTNAGQFRSDIAMDDSGDFAVSWTSGPQDGGLDGVYTQQYLANGTKNGGELRANTYTTNSQNQSRIAMDSDGDYVIVWQSYAQTGDAGWGIRAQRYTANPVVNNPPTINPQTMSVAENSPVGTVVGTVVASDPGDTLTYTFTGGNINKAFAINPTTGQITANRTSQLNFENIPSYALRVQVTDSIGQSRKATITVNLTNVNEQPTLSPQSFTVPENSPAGTVVGIVVATDPDTGSSLSYVITGGNTNKAFSINANTGQILVSRPQYLDFENPLTYKLSVQATDPGGLFRKAVMTINITNVNEQPQISPQSFTVAENSANGTVVGTVSASDPDAGAVLVYSISGGNVSSAFAINSSNGQITVNNSAALDFETRPTFSLTIQVTDQFGLFRKAVITINLTNVSDLTAALSDKDDDRLFSTFPSLTEFSC